MFPFDKPVLIVDDMEVVRRVVRAELQKIGFKKIIEAMNGEQAYNLIQNSMTKEPIQLMILDWNMPEMTGIDLLKKLRGNTRTRNLPIIMLTAEAEMDNVMEAIQNGVNSYIIQPFDEDQIKEKILHVWSKLQAVKTETKLH